MTKAPEIEKAQMPVSADVRRSQIQPLPSAPPSFAFSPVLRRIIRDTPLLRGFPPLCLSFSFVGNLAGILKGKVWAKFRYDSH